MKSFQILILSALLAIISCNKESKDINNDLVETQKYYVVMKITVENQRAKLINDRFEKFDTKQFETLENYVSDVEEISRNSPIDEDTKFRMLDNFERKLINQLQYDIIVLDRKVEIYNSYAEASNNR